MGSMQFSTTEAVANWPAHFDSDDMFEIGARLSGAAAILREQETFEQDDLLMFAERLILDAARIADRCALAIERHNLDVRKFCEAQKTADA